MTHARKLTLAICFVFLTISAHAQTTDVNKNWTTVGSAGTLDEKSVGKVFFDHSIVQMGQLLGPTTISKAALVATQTDSAVIRYNVTAVDSFFVRRSLYSGQLTGCSIKATLPGFWPRCACNRQTDRA